jgi:hypothetical protein
MRERIGAIWGRNKVLLSSLHILQSKPDLGCYTSSVYPSFMHRIIDDNCGIQENSDLSVELEELPFFVLLCRISDGWEKLTLLRRQLRGKVDCLSNKPSCLQSKLLCVLDATAPARVWFETLSELG